MNEASDGMQGATVVLTGLTGSHQAHSLVEMGELKWETVNSWNDNMRQINRFLLYHTLQRNKIIPKRIMKQVVRFHQRARLSMVRLPRW